MMGLKPNVSTFTSIIPLRTRMKCLDIGKSIHCFVVESGFSSDEFLTPALISMYAGGGNLFIARDLFDSTAEKNVVIWNSMVRIRSLVKPLKCSSKSSKPICSQMWSLLCPLFLVVRTLLVW